MGNQLEKVLLDTDEQCVKMLNDGRMFIARRDGAILVRPGTDDEHERMAVDVCYPVEGKRMLEARTSAMLMTDRLWPVGIKMPADTTIPCGDHAVIVTRGIEPGVWQLERTGDGEWRRTGYVDCSETTVLDVPTRPLQVTCTGAVHGIETLQELSQVDYCSLRACRTGNSMLEFVVGTDELFLMLAPAFAEDKKMWITLEDGSQVEGADWSDEKAAWETMSRRVNMGILGSGLPNPETGKKFEKEDKAAAKTVAKKAKEPSAPVDEVKLSPPVIETIAATEILVPAAAEHPALEETVADIKEAAEPVEDIKVPEELQHKRTRRRNLYKEVVDDELNKAVEAMAADVAPISDTESFNKASAEVKVLRDLISKAVSRMANLSTAIANYATKMSSEDRFAKIAELIDNMRK